MTRSEVLIIGAGPTGLVLALWLTRFGVKVRIIDRTAGPGTTSRALAVQARTLELYRQLDLADAVVAGGHKVPAVNLWVKGEPAARLPFETIGADLTPYPFLQIFPQDQHERLLIERLQALGVSVERQRDGADNFGSLAAMGWQVHVYGSAGTRLRAWCESHKVPLCIFDWRPEHGAAGLSSDALYLLRPDSYVALAEASGAPDAVDRYFAERGIRVGVP